MESPGTTTDPGCYEVAGQRIVIDPPLPELELYACDLPAPPAAADAPKAASRRVFSGEAPLGSSRPWIDCEWRGDGYRLAIAGAGRFTVSIGGDRIVGARGNHAEGYVEAMLGPALILALALRGVWCLHASAVAVDGGADGGVDGGVVAFVGESGAGKSTLARELPKLGERAYQRVADDILPLAIEAGRACVLPRFPQLKCPSDAQPGLALPPSLPLAAVYLLGPEASEVTAEPLAGTEAALALVRHTVASRLFTPELLSHHMDFCAAVTARIPVRRLLYRRRMGELSRVEKCLRRALSGIGEARQ